MPYETLPENWSRALAVVAHPDDLEYGASGAVARWTAEGRTVTYVLVTRGEAGIDTIAPTECGPLRERHIAVFGSPAARHAVDIGATFDRAVASLQAHAAYLAALGGPPAAELLRDAAAEAGARLPGATLAAAFELVGLTSTP